MVVNIENYNINEELKKIDKERSVSSFEYFLPFSDSIIIVSGDLNLFIKQVSAFILNCFLYISDAYMKPENIKLPEEVTIEDIKASEDGKLLGTEARKEYWFPPLFRGGISYNDVNFIQSISIYDNKAKYNEIISGKAFIESFKLEKIGKGPRLFCDEGFYNQLNNDSKFFIEPFEPNSCLKRYEILWPVIHYIESNRCDSEINRFHELFVPAVNLWKAYNHLGFSEHYYNFVKLIVRSTLKFSMYCGCFKVAREKIEGFINEYGLEIKKDDLMGDYSSESKSESNLFNNNKHFMIVTAWNNGSHNKSGSGYGIRIRIKDRKIYFNQDWSSVIIQLKDESESEFNLSHSFWQKCPDIRSKIIGKWLIKNQLAPWPKRKPPKLKLETISERKFKLSNDKNCNC